MKDKNCPRNGVIYCEDKQKFNFYLNDYTATFMEPDHSEIYLDGHFLFGCTSGFNSIAIFKGDSIPSFSGATVLNTNAYLIAVENGLGTKWDSFDSIEFTGGILNSLFLCDALKCEDMENGDILVHRQNTHKRWTFEIDDGSYRVMNQKIALTAYLFQGLAYCCLLTRIGIRPCLKNRKVMYHFNKIAIAAM